MITQFINRFFGLLASTLLISNSFAQVSEIKNLQPLLLHENSVKVYKHLLDEFEKRFPTAESVEWSKVDKNFLAVFKIDNYTHRAVFTPKAKLVYTIFYGHEKDLPTYLRKMVKEMYVEFEITAAVKVEQFNRTIWIINLHDPEYLVSVRAENGEAEELWKYSKYSPKPGKAKLAKR